MTLREASAELRHVAEMVDKGVANEEASQAVLVARCADIEAQLAESTADVGRLLGELAAAQTIAVDLHSRLAKSNDYARGLTAELEAARG